MAEPPPHPDGVPEIDDVDWPLGDRPAKAPAPKGSTPPPAAHPGEGYAVVGLDHDVADEPPVRPPIPTPPPRTAKPKSKPVKDLERSARADPVPEATVDEVWTRRAEWGPNLVALALAAPAAGGLIVCAVAQAWFVLALLLMLAAGAGLLLLSYPIAITLERPVRITPEQAVRDYYAALSHRIPHYRRMWLLLSSAGKASRWFGSLEGFKGYWEGRLKMLKGGRAGKYTPLKFQVEDFRAEKSAGKTSLPAKFTVKVYVRGRQDAGPIASYRVETGLVKGPDKMWYLNDGTLPADAVNHQRRAERL
ncbi:MAG TPA: hypothetical protein VKP69_25530 [Isosphaeraceae bacterium]|nr:hypothetical protein [Isosphaeraceae bacterium]